MSHSCFIQFHIEWVFGEFDQACVCTSSWHENEVQMEGNIIVALKCYCYWDIPSISYIFP